jgi:hypothetical protein
MNVKVEGPLYAVVAVLLSIFVMPFHQKTNKHIAWLVVNPLTKFACMCGLYVLASYTPLVAVAGAVGLSVIDYDMAAAAASKIKISK